VAVRRTEPSEQAEVFRKVVVIGGRRKTHRRAPSDLSVTSVGGHDYSRAGTARPRTPAGAAVKEQDVVDTAGGGDARGIASGRKAATAEGTRTTVCLSDLELDAQAIASDERVRANLWPRHAARARIRACRRSHYEIRRSQS
jgi:hypothetical protein